MPSGYTPSRVQEYWRDAWERAGVYETPAEPDDPTYVLGMFPYTSGALHMGHVRNYAITDAVARYRRMSGDDVLHPMGWDAFGLPAENAAYERETDPETWTRQCIERMREELESMGFGYDWSREVTTCDPEYYRWNQWLFLQLREAGLVERKAAAVNWCPDCETVLADAQVEQPAAADGTGVDGTDLADHPGPGHDPGQGVCWRCGTRVEERDLDQYFFTITDYAEELDDGLDDLDGWPQGVREIQRDWIGRQEGATIDFDVRGADSVAAFTTRADTVFGATFLAVAPGHELVESIAESNDAVAAYVDRVGTAPHDRSDAEGSEELSGVRTDCVATNPITGAEIPVYVADYVVEDVGTGAVMGVPAHNERDYRFATEHDLPVETVVEPDEAESAGDDKSTLPSTDHGVLRVDGPYDGLTSAAARERLLDEEPAITPHTTYRLRDWLISRQRYWGTPIPLIHCADCGTVPVPEENLPVELPEFVQTTGNPLAASEAFVNTECPECGGPAERETDTMDTFVDSSWYFLRYLSPHLDSAPFDQTAADRWLPVDVYVGGEEHAVLHLLYIRFFTRALADLDLLDRREPVTELVNQGTVLHEGQKMSKSKGNAVAPHEYGAETTRLFVLSAAHPARDFEWTAKDVGDAYDFLQSVYGMVEQFAASDARMESADHDAYLERATDRTIAAVTDEYERFRFHRVVAECQRFARLLRRYRNYAEPYEYAYARGLRTLTLLLAPIAPYLAEECWQLLDEDGLAAEADWPRPLQESDAYAIERGLVRRTLEDVREITDVAGMDPDHVEIAVAPAWKYDAYEIARTAAPGEAIVGEILDTPEMPARAVAGPYAADLQERSAGLEPILDADRELSVLQEATWLFEDEFGATVEIHRAVEGDLAETAEPNRPAIHVD